MSCRALRDAEESVVLRGLLTAEERLEWRDRATEEAANVARLLGADVLPAPVEIVVERRAPRPGAPFTESLGLAGGGMRGWTVLPSQIHIVAGAAGPSALPLGVTRTLRHELVHVALHRLAPDAPAWLDEGLAHECEDAVVTGSRVRLHPAPVQIVLAQSLLASEGSCGSLWDWDGGRTDPPEREAVLRALARSFVRFLLEGDEPPLDDRVRQIALLRPAHDPGIVDAWHAWLREFDFAAAVRDALSDPSPEIRIAAVRGLPVLAESAHRLAPHVPAMARCVDSRTDAVAVEAVALGDADVVEAAGRYLAYYRAAGLSPASAEALWGTPEGGPGRLVVLAVRARRGETPDAREVRAIWDTLQARTRRRFRWIGTFLPLPAEDTAGR